ncbi:uncharacterized protein LOC131250827 [Magnolia sinica]|uniref:uncharacterized protein LOC131250827 n=1 Tax=Magnolia sinica TaxID=86752 RepID=UPI0026596EAF|nr:uncharacterized protein LOC131250827 [Magnolia sinica]
MAVSNIHLSLLVFLVAGILLSGYKRALADDVDCKGDLSDLIQECSDYVKKSGPPVPPSQECCVVVRRVDLPCVCKYVTKEVEKIISMEKVVYIAKYCKRPLKPGTKCESYIVTKA